MYRNEIFMKITNIFRHFALIWRHKARVFQNAVKCGIAWRGLVHDLSKFSPAEFFESVKYYRGNRSPIGAARRETGVSYAWLHHKGRNKHHIEYWLDGDCAVTPEMPYVYAVECICDKIAATKTYAGTAYHDGLPIHHFRHYGNKVEGNPHTMRFVDTVLADLARYGEKHVLNRAYLKSTYDRIHAEPLPPATRTFRDDTLFPCVSGEGEKKEP